VPYDWNSQHIEADGAGGEAAAALRTPVARRDTCIEADGVGATLPSRRPPVSGTTETGVEAERAAPGWFLWYGKFPHLGNPRVEADGAGANYQGVAHPTSSPS
jgi:hypothetical protein